MNYQNYFIQVVKNASACRNRMSALSTQQKNQALEAIAESLEKRCDAIVQANQQDLQAAEQNQLSAALIDRLLLDETRIQQMIQGIREIIALPDPVGEISDLKYRPSGIQVGKMRVPIGVLGIIYESRPNVTIDAAALSFKSGNVCILRGGKEAIHSNLAIYQSIAEGLTQANCPQHGIQILQHTDRQLVDLLVQANDYVDVIIPRGGKGLVQLISEKSKVPVIKHLDGNCHLFIDEGATPTMAHDIAINAKTRRYGVCNALETLLIHKSEVDTVLPSIAQSLMDKQVEIRGCEQICQRLSSSIPAIPATTEDWYTEYLSAILSIKVVSSIDEAIKHINHYGSAHTDAIVTNDYQRGLRFMREVDSSSVIINASTSFADGFEYGLGAEIGISTDRLHVRGPVGLEGLTTQKYIVLGHGETR